MKKRRKTVTVRPNQQASLKLLGIPLGALALLVFLWSWSQCTIPSFTEHTERRYTTAVSRTREVSIREEIPAILKQERATPEEMRLTERLNDRLNRVLPWAAEGDAEAEQLVEFFRRCAHYGRPRVFGAVSMVTQFSPPADDPCKFVIVIGTLEEFRIVGLQTASNWRYLGEHRFITVHSSETLSDLFAATAFLHELLHAYLHIQEGQQSSLGSDPNAPALLREEVRAHLLEDRLLSLRTNGRYDQVMDATLRSLPALPPGHAFTAIPQDASQRILAVFGQTFSQDDRDMAGTQFMISLGLRNARANSATDSAAIRSLRTFYDLVIPDRAR